MPIYEYKCIDCNHRFTLLKTIEEKEKDLCCPECKQENVKKLISSFAVVGGNAKESRSGGFSSESSSENNVVYPDNYIESLPPCHELRRGNDFSPMEE